MRVLDAINDIIDSNAGLRLRKNHSGGRVTPLSSPISPTSDHSSVRSPKAMTHRAKIVSADERTRSVRLKLDATGGYHHKSSGKHYRNSFLRVANEGSNGAVGGRLSHVADADEDDALDMVVSCDDDQTWKKVTEGVLTSIHFDVKPHAAGGMMPVSAKFADSALDESASKFLKLTKRGGSVERVNFRPRFAHAVGHLTKGDVDPFRQIIAAGPSNLMKVSGPKLPSEKSAQVDTFRKIHRTGRQRASF